MGTGSHTPTDRLPRTAAVAWRGDASGLPLREPIVGATATADGKGYWLIAGDGGIFTFGDAPFFGSMGAAHLNQPVVSMAPTMNGKGYWLVARDGGVFTFGNARFHGSTGNLTLSQPINGITTSPTGNGYRMVAADGGIFSFGDVPFYGSLPGRGAQVTDVVGMAPTPTNRGYWVARATGSFAAFGDANGGFNPYFGITSCDPVVAIIANPKLQGFRLATRSGATIPIGSAPGGAHPTGTPGQCPAPPPSPADPTMSLAEFSRIRPGMSYQDVVAIVGGPGTLVDSSFAGARFTEYQWSGNVFVLDGDEITSVALVDFVDNREYDKFQFGLS